MSRATPFAAAVAALAILAAPWGVAAAATPAEPAVPAPAPEAAAADAGLARLADEYFDAYYFPTHPTDATSVGIHRYDDRLEDLSRAAVQREIRVLLGWEQRFAAVSPGALSEHAREYPTAAPRVTIVSHHNYAGVGPFLKKGGQSHGLVIS